MDRRGFLKLLIGGVATTAAVRTFPFRVYSFPTELAAPWPILVAPGWGYTDAQALFLSSDGVYRIFSGAAPGWKKVSQEIDIAKAKQMFPGPFHWQGASDEVRYSVLQSDGSVIDA